MVIRMLIVFNCIVWCTWLLPAQETAQLTGIWKGAVAGTTLIIEIDDDVNNPYKAYLSLPAQGLDSLSAQRVTVIQDSVILLYSLMGRKIEIATMHQKDTLTGTYQMGPSSYPLTLIKKDRKIPLRLQNPKAPFNYTVEDLKFYNSEADITLEGTLTTPKDLKDFPVVVLISGSGLQNRDSELLGHKPFLVIADYLTNKGIGVFRYDERGVGASEGAPHDATSIDFKSDVLAAVTKLDSLGYKQLGLIGHSEGGLIAPMAAVQNKLIDFIITLAGPGRPIAEMMLLQNKLILEEQGLLSEQVIEDYLVFTSKVYALIDIETPKDTLYAPLRTLCSEFYNSQDSSAAQVFGPNETQFYMAYGMQMFNPWYRWFINYDPQPTIKQLSCPVLALNGNLDIQVPSGPNLEGFRTMLKQSAAPSYEVIELDSLNHLFQKVNTRSTKAYYDSPETFNEEALDLIVEWIRAL